MRPYRKLATACAAIICFGFSQALAAEGAWKFEVDNRDHPILSYAESGKAIFMIGCGRAFGLHVRYPATPKKDGKATITLANSKTRIKFVGEFEEPDATSDTTFLQWDLGYRRQDPQLYGKQWNRKKTELLDLLASGPITVSAEGHSYQIPGAAVPDWRAAFEKCG
jgi:hypothetical protein